MDKVFTQDELEQSSSFIKYCTRPDTALQAEWEAYVRAYPGEMETVWKARANIQALYAMLGDVYSTEAAEGFRQLLLQRENQLESSLPEEPAAEIRSGTRKYWLAAAAVLLVILGAGGALLFRRTADTAVTAPSLAERLETGYGTKSKRILPDGTTVWLNAGSKLSYNDREATLEGEAFFDVAKDAGHPFIVHAGGVTIEVLGTTFNVKAYDSEENVEATLISGRIRVQLNHLKGEKIMLAPNEKLIIRRLPATNNNTQTTPDSREREKEYRVQSVVKPDNSPYLAETAWVNNTLVFTNETFGDVATKLERWYNVRIRFENDQLKQEQLSGIFEEEDVQQALQILQMTTRFKYRITDSEIVIF